MSRNNPHDKRLQRRHRQMRMMQHLRKKAWYNDIYQDSPTDDGLLYRNTIRRMRLCKLRMGYE